MIVWHVTSAAKLGRYLRSGEIAPPVRAWPDIQDAARFSVSTGRRVILRLRFPPNAAVLEGHQGRARVLQQVYRLKGGL